MPTSVGPNPSADSNIVFSYDVGDTSNSYIGEPTVNYYGDIDSSIALRTPLTEYNTSNWTANFSKPPINIGRVYKHTSGALSSTWSGNSYGYTLKYYTYPAGAIYTLSAWVYVSPDCNISQLNVSIEGGGSWIDYNYQYDLNNKGTWQRIWLEINTLGGFAGNAIPIYPQRWGVTDGSFTGFYAWGGVMLEAKDHITQYTVGTRSATQGLLPLISNTSLNISTVSFNSNAQLVFDGTDDYINLPTNFQSGYTQATYEFICRPTSLPGAWNYFQLYIQETSTWIALYNVGGGAFFGIDLNNGSGWFDGNGGSTTGAKTTATLTANTYYHIVYSWDGTVVRIYLNGVLQSTTSTLQASNGRQNVTTLGAGDTPRNIGARGGGNYWPGTIDVVKFYNTAISTDQVQQNYRQYKSRFNLS
jgi:hypothetical protein